MKVTDITEVKEIDIVPIYKVQYGESFHVVDDQVNISNTKIFVKLTKKSTHPEMIDLKCPPHHCLSMDPENGCVVIIHSETLVRVVDSELQYWPITTTKTLQQKLKENCRRESS